MNIRYGFTIKEWKPRQWHFGRAVPPLVVSGTYKTRDRGGSGSWRETMTMGRALAASPRSASQILPGWGFIEQGQDLLFGGARERDIQDVVIG